MPPIPTDPVTIVRLNAATQLAAGLMLATGKMPRLSANLLALTMVPTTVAGHPFWEEKDKSARANQMVHFGGRQAIEPARGHQRQPEPAQRVAT